MNLEAAITLRCYGTSEGVAKEWDTRGRGRKPHEMTQTEFVGHASGQTYSDALDNRVRPAPPEEVQRIQGLEKTKGQVRDAIRKKFPAAKTWGYETSWRHNQDQLKTAHHYFVQRALKRGANVPDEVMKDYPDLHRRPTQAEKMKQMWPGETERMKEMPGIYDRVAEIRKNSQAKATQ